MKEKRTLILGGSGLALAAGLLVAPWGAAQDSGPPTVVTTDGATIVVAVDEVPVTVPKVVLIGLPANGVLYYTEDGNPDGLYAVDMGDGSLVNLGLSGVGSSTNGLAPSGDPSLLYGSQPFGLNHTNADGSGAAFIGGDTQEGLAYDAGTGTLYGAINGILTTVNPADGLNTATLMAPGFDAEGLAVGNGVVYAIGGGTSTLNAYDPGSNTWSTIGDTGVVFDNCGLAYNAVENALYAKNGIGDTNLYRINPANAALAIVGDTGIAAGGGLAWVGPEPCPPNPCPWDNNGDGVVNVLDLLGVLLNFGPCPQESECDGGGFVCGGDIIECQGSKGFQCVCFFVFEGGEECLAVPGCGVTCFNGSSDCPAGQTCIVDTCCGDPVCAAPCPLSPGELDFERGELTAIGVYDPETW